MATRAAGTHVAERNFTDNGININATVAGHPAGMRAMFPGMFPEKPAVTVYIRKAGRPVAATMRDAFCDVLVPVIQEAIASLADKPVPAPPAAGNSGYKWVGR